MKPDNFDFIGNFSTLWQVFLGAVLATVGGLAATQLEWHFERKRRAQQAAMFFGEVLTTLHIILDIAHRTHGRGDPFGPITLRMLRAGKREIEIYDRNRETLFDLHDPKLRARIHTLILRLSNPLESVLDTTDEIRAVETQLRALDLTAEHREHLQERLARLNASRDGGYEFTIESAGQLLDTVKALEVLSKQSFSGAERAEAEAAQSGT
ncbi:MAG TPA: hypothetical protein VHU87_13220 [Rhizomicrobium sp.]|nr:hypothetical protein [Rhizomicrobium sp.]